MSTVPQAKRRLTTRGPSIVLAGSAGAWDVVVGSTRVGEVVRLNTRKWLNSAFDVTRSRKAGVARLIAHVLDSGARP